MTATEVQETALRKLGVLGNGETADTNDLAIAAEAWTQLAAEIDVSASTITDGTGVYLASMLAADLVDEFEIPEQKAQRLLSMREMNRREVKKVLNSAYDTTQVIEAEYY